MEILFFFSPSEGGPVFSLPTFPPVQWSPVPNLPKSAGLNLPCAFGLGEDNRRGQ